MKALQYNRFGDAEQVLTMVDRPEPGAPGPGEVLVAVLYSPLNSHDLGRIAGRVAPPALPAVAPLPPAARIPIHRVWTGRPAGPCPVLGEALPWKSLDVLASGSR